MLLLLVLSQKSHELRVCSLCVLGVVSSPPLGTTRLPSNLFSPPDGNRRQFRICLHVSNEEKKTFGLIGSVSSVITILNLV